MSLSSVHLDVQESVQCLRFQSVVVLRLHQHQLTIFVKTHKIHMNTYSNDIGRKYVQKSMT